MPPSQAQQLPLEPRRTGAFLCSALFILIGSYIYLSYWEYSRAYYGSPNEWSDLLAGKGAAPFQYRLGVLVPADAIGRMLPHHLPLRLTLTLLDLLFLFVGCVTLFRLLARTNATTKSREHRWGIVTLALFLLTFDLLWTLWYHKPETIASFFCLTVSLWLIKGAARIPRGLAVVLLVGLAAYAATVRADTIFAFHAGMLLACLLPGAATMPLGRVTQGIGSLVSIIAILGIEWYIKNVLYPLAPFKAALFQLVHNLHPANLAVVFLALAPYGATLWLAGRAWKSIGAWERGLVLGSVVDFGFYFVVGRSNEVRIFLPFAMTLLVLSAPLLYAHFVEAERSSGD